MSYARRFLPLLGVVVAAVATHFGLVADRQEIRAQLGPADPAAAAQAAPQTPRSKSITELPLLRETVIGRAMGTEFTITVYTRPGDVDTETVRRIAEVAFARIEALDARISRWLPNSQTSALNAHGAEGPVPVGPELLDLILFSKRVCRDTGGAFDVTVGPLLDLWGVYRGEGRLPEQHEIDQALQCIGLDKVLVDRDARTVTFTHPGVRLDFGGIGKGLALDVAAQALKESGVACAFLDGGASSFLAIGSPPGTDGWTVQVRDPYNKDRIIAELTLRDESYSTSGCGEGFLKEDGTIYCHIFDPRTGWPVQGMLSAAAFAPTGILSDALSTAFFVMGEEGMREYCRSRPEVRAMFVPVPDEGDPVVRRINFPESKELS